MAEITFDFERRLAEALTPKTVRCRLFRDGVVIQLDPDSLAHMKAASGASLRAGLADLLRAHGETRPVRYEPYRMGSAFHKPPAHG